MPDEVHRKLKRLAARNRRSMNRQAILLLENSLSLAAAEVDLPAPLRGKFPLTDAFLDRARRRGRP